MPWFAAELREAADSMLADRAELQLVDAGGPQQGKLSAPTQPCLPAAQHLEGGEPSAPCLELPAGEEAARMLLALEQLTYK